MLMLDMIVFWILLVLPLLHALEVSEHLRPSNALRYGEGRRKGNNTWALRHGAMHHQDRSVKKHDTAQFDLTQVGSDEYAGSRQKDHLLANASGSKSGSAAGASSTASKSLAEANSTVVTNSSTKSDFAQVSKYLKWNAYSRPDWKTHKQRLIFVHIPKNAGTAIEQAGQQGGVWWPRKWLSFWHGMQMPDGSFCEKYHVPPHVLKTLGDPDYQVFDDPGTFCVTRHPYERAISEYKYMLSVAWGRSMSEQYGTGLYEKPMCSKEGLNNFLKKAMFGVKSGKRFMHDCHMLPQSEFIWGNDGKQWCRHVLSSKGLEKQFNKLMEDHRYPVRMAMTRNNNSSTTCPHLSESDLELDTRRLLDDVYHQDLQKLNYSSSQKDFVFMHIPRNAGTTIEEAAEAHKVSWPRSWKSFKAKRMAMPDGSWCDKHLVPSILLEAKDAEVAYGGKDVFCISRHPYERAVSVFKDVLTSQDGSAIMSYYGVTPYHGPNISFGLNDFLQKTVAVMQNGRTFAFDCGMAPQHMYIWNPDGNQTCHTILKAEQLPLAFDELMVEKGFPKVQIGQPVQTGTSVNASGFASLAQSSGPNAQQDLQVSLKDLYPETRALLDLMYAEDFSRLEYNSW